MTAFDRVEQRLPELIDELASAHRSRLRRQPAPADQPDAAAASLEPPRKAASDGRHRPNRFPIQVAVAALALAALSSWLAGALLTRRLEPAVPGPVRPGSNGSIVYGTDEGDIASLDPCRGASTTILGGPTKDIAPLLSRDGTKLAFVRNLEGRERPVRGERRRLRRSAAGRRVLRAVRPRPVPRSTGLRAARRWLRSPMRSPVPLRNIQILATDGSASRTLHLGMNVTRRDLAAQRPGAGLQGRAERDLRSLPRQRGRVGAPGARTAQRSPIGLGFADPVAGRDPGHLPRNGGHVRGRDPPARGSIWGVDDS